MSNWKIELRKLREMIDRKRAALDKPPTPIQKEHVAEQMEALTRDVKSGAAFSGPHWKVEDKPE
jgi:hypothetical protein